MRIEIAFIAGVVLCRVFSRTGALVAHGQGYAEADAREKAGHLLLAGWRNDLALFADLTQEVADEIGPCDWKEAAKVLYSRILL
jgi:hypothetical protein